MASFGRKVITIALVITMLSPIRTGVDLRIGANIGYLHCAPEES
ncbi:MAG TPA: hypothetical protein QF813_01715 [Alphaproteobacteria bacterium]|jgi:hypothetical protein|nr:hypothetical protein [Alphaproteobacteria bacterium]